MLQTEGALSVPQLIVDNCRIQRKKILSRRRRLPEEEMRTPLLSLIDAVENFSALVNSIVDEIQERTPVTISREARGALFLALALWLAYRFPDTFSFFLTNSRALVIIAILVCLAMVDIAAKTLRPRRLRIQKKLQEIMEGIIVGGYSPEDAAAYLGEQTFPSDLLEQCVVKFAELPPVVQESLVENQSLTAEQLNKLESVDLDVRIVRTLVERHPRAFSRILLDTWVRKFKDNREFILAVVRHQLSDSSFWRQLDQQGVLSEEISKPLKVELEYVQKPSRVAAFLQSHSTGASFLVVGSLFVAFVIVFFTLVASRFVIQIPGGDFFSIMVATYLLYILFFMIFMFVWFSLVSGLSRLLQAFGDRAERRAKAKLSKQFGTDLGG